MNLQNQEIDTNAETNLNVPYYKKVVLPTTDEVEKHKEYLKSTLKKNFY